MKITARSRVILKIAGTGLIILAILSAAFPAVFTTSSTPIKYGAVNLELVTTTPQLDPRGEVVVGRESIHTLIMLTYPREIRENQTSVVSVKIDGHVEHTTVNSPASNAATNMRQPGRLTLDEHGALRLSSSGFTISPFETIEKPPDTPLPTEYAWTLSPHRDGEHQLLLDLSEFARASEYDEHPSAALSVNGEPRAFNETGILRLAVTVLTPWGVSAMTATLLRSAIGLIGFVLLYPVVAEWLRRRMLAR